MSPIELPIRRFPAGKDLPLPSYVTPGSAGLDLRAAVGEQVWLQPGARALIPTGFGIALPQGYEAQVRPRSGLAVGQGLTLLNSPGTVDSDYRGEIKVVMINLGESPAIIRRGDRIAQLIVSEVAAACVVETEPLPPSSRGEGGFGHTGI